MSRLFGLPYYSIYPLMGYPRSQRVTSLWCCMDYHNEEECSVEIGVSSNSYNSGIELAMRLMENEDTFKCVVR